MKGCLGRPGPSLSGLSEASFILAGSFQAEEPLDQSAEPPHVLLVSVMAERLRWLLHASPPLTFMEKMAL